MNTKNSTLSFIRDFTLTLVVGTVVYGCLFLGGCYDVAVGDQVNKRK